MFNLLVDAFLTGVVFNRTAEDAGIKMLDIEGIMNYWLSYLIVNTSGER